MLRRLSVLSTVAVFLILVLNVYAKDSGKEKKSKSKYTASTVKNVKSGGDASELVLEKTPEDVVNQHLKALNACDWKALLAQYPDQIEIHLPGGTIIKGRQATADLFVGFVLPPKDCGLCGITFSEESSQNINGTLVVQWVANADFLEEPYKGSDAYITEDGLMVAMVTTFNGSDLKMKKTE